VIYVVEFPHRGRAHAWFAFDRDDFARKVYATDERSECEIFDIVNARGLLDLLGVTPDEPAARAGYPAICALGDLHGWDTPLYRADYLSGTGMLQPESISECDACAAALEHRLRAYRIYWTDAQATAALESDPVWHDLEGAWARDALREQLIALEVLEGPHG
jgi:hypothetical protein